MANGNEPASPLDQVTFIGKFIDKYYVRQPLWLQSGTFVVFLLLFVYGFINLLNGKYVLKGSLWVQKPASECPQKQPCSAWAPYYEVRWGQQAFVSNSTGDYYVAIGLPEYLKALATGSHQVTLVKDGTNMGGQSLKINRLEGEFDDVTIKLPADQTANLRTEPGWSLIPSVWASISSGRYRLLVEGVTLAGAPAKTSATFELLADSRVIPLQDHNASDMTTGPIPILGMGANDLGGGLYFSLPGNSLPVNGAVRVTTNAGGIFQFSSNSEESFPLLPQQSIGSAMQLRGTKGSSLTLRIVFSQDVKVFRKSALLGKKQEFESELRKQGLLARWSDPPLGTQTETDSLWTGPEVPFDVVQRLLRVAVDEDIELKQIGYRYAFKSTSNPTEIQFGSDRSCASTPRIPATVLQKAIDAKNETEFVAAITDVSSCSSPRATAITAKGKILKKSKR